MASSTLRSEPWHRQRRNPLNLACTGKEEMDGEKAGRLVLLVYMQLFTSSILARSTRACKTRKAAKHDANQGEAQGPCLVQNVTPLPICTYLINLKPCQAFPETTWTGPSEQPRACRMSKIFDIHAYTQRGSW